MSSNTLHNSFIPLLSPQDLTGKWPEQDSTGDRPTTGGSRHHKQQETHNGADSLPQNVQVVLCGVRNPTNVGSILRTCACFGISQLLHLHSSSNDETNSKYWTEPHVKGALERSSVGTCSQFQQRDKMPMKSISISRYTKTLNCASNESRRPLVVLEAIAGAVSIDNYHFPETCDVMVGSEHRGVPKDILQQLVQGVDAVVYIPLAGPHKSLNVSAALTIALYEYQRQWPGIRSTCI